MYILKIIILSCIYQLSLADSDDPFDNYQVTSYSTSVPDTVEEIRSLVTKAAQDVVSIGYTRHKSDKHKPEQSYQTSTASPELKTSSPSQSHYPSGYDDHPSSTQASFKYTPTYPTQEPSSSHYPETTLTPPAYDYSTTSSKNHKHDLYQPTRSPLLNHQSTPIQIDYEPHGSKTTSAPISSTPLEQYKGTPAPLPPQYNPQSQYAHYPIVPQAYPSNQSPPPIPQSPYYPSVPIIRHQYDYYQSTPAPVPPFDHYHAQGPPVPQQYYPHSPQTQTSYPLASGSIHTSTTVKSHGEVGTTTPSQYDVSTVAPLQPQYDFVHANYESPEISSPPPQPYDHSLTIAPPVPPQYDQSAYLTIPDSQQYFEPIYRPYSTPLRKHNPSPTFEFHPTPHNPTHYIHNIPHYLTPSYDAYTQAPYPNGGGHPHYFKPLYNPYNPSIPQYSVAAGGHPYQSQPYTSHKNPLPELTQYDAYNNYPPIYRPPVPPNYQPHQAVKSSHSSLYHVQASKELHPTSSTYSTERTQHELKEAKEYKQHGYHNYQISERPVRYHVKEEAGHRY